MSVPQLDRSNYLKGLLIIARKDKHLAESEKTVLKQLSDKLGFSSDFYEETITNLLNNKYLTEEPIKFSSVKIARSFIEDGLRLAWSDKVVTDEEINWLKETAGINGIEEKWLIHKSEEMKTKPHLLLRTEFALYGLI
jgi:hypothetical protein